MKTSLLLALVSQLAIYHQSNQVVVRWMGNWSLQSSTNMVQWHTEPATNTIKFFRLVSPATSVFCVIRNGETNDFVVPVGSNQYRSYVWLAAITEPLSAHPTFMVRSGQAHLHPPLFTDVGILRESESRGVYDAGIRAYCVTVDIQDRITTPLVIRVIGGTQAQPYWAYARFTNP